LGAAARHLAGAQAEQTKHAHLHIVETKADYAIVEDDEDNANDVDEDDQLLRSCVLAETHVGIDESENNGKECERKVNDIKDGALVMRLLLIAAKVKRVNTDATKYKNAEQVAPEVIRFE
jgi:hypothetical protein